MKNLLTLILLFTLTGCASLTLQPTHTTPWPQRQTQLTALKQWSAEGSIGARSSKQGLNASFAWQQQTNDYTIQLFGPLGIHRTQLAGNKQQVTLQTSDQTYSARNPEILLQQRTGWRLPVSNLYYWLRGLPAPNTRYIKTLDEQHHIVQLKQAGWDVQYLGYTPVKHLDLPERILLTNPQWQVRLVIHNWQLNDSY
jgi:outer membrane lipoprotein LolB